MTLLCTNSASGRTQLVSVGTSHDPGIEQLAEANHVSTVEIWERLQRGEAVDMPLGSEGKFKNIRLTYRRAG